jgi:hypothetical protein
LFERRDIRGKAAAAPLSVGEFRPRMASEIRHARGPAALLLMTAWRWFQGGVSSGFETPP